MYKLHHGCLVVFLVASAVASTRLSESIDMQQFSVHVYGNETHDISPLLYGIFFEEVLSNDLALTYAVGDADILYCLGKQGFTFCL